ncbi:cardiolipin synthase [Clostridium sp. DSM 8431]|uniref:cardiolipin synthase n=1 Tax=Clostridium sp. DSM 8431 TaxID=1761781 RepID=UPI0008E920B5|nr:cardiolipin synthase [Clostridium sp. DSM 8431]SFU72894.1 cardiolipin synthase [Clostridium sp. DSM 8431]
MIINIIFRISNIIDFLAILYMIFKEKRSANSIVAWSLIFYLIPVLGLVLFMFIGRKINQSSMYGIRQSDRNMYKKFKEEYEKRNILESNNVDKENIDMVNSLENMSYSPYREGNKITVFNDGKELFNDMIEHLKTAKKSINIQFYIFKRDELGSSILDVLKDKAREGVEVKFLYDSLGCRELSKKKLRDVEEAGVKIAEFFPSHIKPFNINMNHRNHRKIVIIDNEISYVGGFNVGDEYLGKNKRFGYWRDTHIRINGYATVDLNLRFLADWKYASKENVDLSKEIILSDKEKGGEGVQIISSVPNAKDLHEIKLTYVKMIQKSKKYVYIQTPYLVLDNSVNDSLKLAALSGVDVRIMIPGKGDHPFVYWVNLSYASELLKYGIKVYHYDKNSFLHSKMVLIDDSITSIGTANMDIRSFELNFEVNALIYSKEIAKKQRKAFEEDIKKSTELTLEEYNSRSRMVKIKEGVSELFSSLL